MVPGTITGTTGGVPTGTTAAQLSFVTVLESRVTAPVKAWSDPTILTPVVAVIDA